MKLSKLNLALIIVCVIVAIVVGIKFSQHQGLSFLAKNATPVRTKGSPNAKVKIVEFADFQCPACAQGVEVINEYMKKYPDSIFVEMKYFPLPGHRYGFLSAQYVECAAQQGKFWPMHDLIFARQNQWKDLMDVRPAFELIAKEVGVDVVKLEECVKDPKVEALLTQNRMEGKDLGVRSTPTYVINGSQMVVGSKSLQEELDKQLGQQK